MKNTMGAKNRIGNWEKVAQHEEFVLEMLYGFTWEKMAPSVPKFVDMSPIGCATLKKQNSQP